MKIAIVTDSGTTLTKQEANELGLYFLPLLILDGETTYRDGIDITNREVFALIEQGKLLKTSFATAGETTELFKAIKKEGYEHILAIPLAENLSGQKQSWQLCADDVGIPISFIETYTLAGVQRYIALAAKQLVDAGKELDEINAILKECIKHSNTLVIPYDLEHLKRGGRLTPMAATLAGMLKIKPILTINEKTGGKLDTFAKVRTMPKALQLAVDAFKKEEDFDEHFHIEIEHTIAPEHVDTLERLYFDPYPKAQKRNVATTAFIAVHTGLGAVAIQYVKKLGEF